ERSLSVTAVVLGVLLRWARLPRHVQLRFGDWFRSSAGSWFAPATPLAARLAVKLTNRCGEVHRRNVQREETGGLQDRQIPCRRGCSGSVDSRAVQSPSCNWSPRRMLPGWTTSA